ncbi:MAG: transglutaminase-like domain-containing protein [Candidatus Bathyarchaeota archaeon]|nr:transglutaminase-like domain-containing protein [Candidatus Bathyarchaeota archaeon]
MRASIGEAAVHAVTESTDHIVKRFNTTVTVVDEKTVQVSIDYGFTWLDKDHTRDTWYVYVGDGAYGITTEDEEGSLNYGTNYVVENGWLPVKLRGEISAGESSYFRVSYYAENRVTNNGGSQPGLYHVAMWIMWDTSPKEVVSVRIVVPSWLSVGRYEPSFLEAEKTRDGATVLSAHAQNVGYDTNYYLNADLVAKQGSREYAPSISIDEWTTTIMAGVPTNVILAVGNLSNDAAHRVNVTVAAPPSLNLSGAGQTALGELRPFETRYLRFTVNASSPGSSYVYATLAYTDGNAAKTQYRNCTIDVTRRVYDTITACNVAPDYIEVSKEASINYVIVPVHEAEASVSLIRPDGSLYARVRRNVTYGSFTVRFPPDTAGNWTASLDVPEADDCRATRMNTTFLVHPTDLYSSQVLSSDNKRLVASYDAEGVYTFTNNGAEADRSPVFDVRLYATLPTQDVTLLSVEPTPISLSYTDSGLRAKFSPLELSPGANYTIVVRFNVKILTLPTLTKGFNGTLDDIPPQFLSYTGYAKYWETNDTSIKQLSRSLTANQSTVSGKIQAIYFWVADNIEYDHEKYNASMSGEPTERYTAPQTLALRKGVCVDISNLFITLCRASGIPAVAITGNTYNGVSGSDNTDNGHAWSAAYVPRYGWVEVDATWKEYARLDAVHIARSCIREASDSDGYYYWNVNNETALDEHLFLIRISISSQASNSTSPSNGAAIVDGGYHTIGEVGTNTLIGVVVITAIIAVIIITPFMVLKRRRAKRAGRAEPYPSQG